MTASMPFQVTPALLPHYSCGLCRSPFVVASTRYAAAVNHCRQCRQRTPVIFLPLNGQHKRFILNGLTPPLFSPHLMPFHWQSLTLLNGKSDDDAFILFQRRYRCNSNMLALSAVCIVSISSSNRCIWRYLIFKSAAQYRQCGVTRHPHQYRGWNSHHLCANDGGSC